MILFLILKLQLANLIRYHQPQTLPARDSLTGEQGEQCARREGNAPPDRRADWMVFVTRRGFATAVCPAAWASVCFAVLAFHDRKVPVQVGRAKFFIMSFSSFNTPWLPQSKYYVPMITTLLQQKRHLACLPASYIVAYSRKSWENWMYHMGKEIQGTKLLATTFV